MGLRKSTLGGWSWGGPSPDTEKLTAKRSRPWEATCLEEIPQEKEV